MNHNPNKIEPRIMIINATPSSAPAQPGQTNGDASAPSMSVAGGGGEMRGGYVGMMNCVFAAQKAVRRNAVLLPVMTYIRRAGLTGRKSR
jgi:transcription initiation factor TFIIH subunit 3